MVGALDSSLSSFGHCIVFLGKKLLAQSASPLPNVNMGTGCEGRKPCNEL